MRLRIRFSKLGKVRFTSHRDVARIWERAFRRAGVQLAYSEGFSPRPKLSFGLALSTGHESLGEYLDAEVDRHAEGALDLDGLPVLLSACLPAGLDVVALVPIAPHTLSLQADVTSCTWVIGVDGVAAEIADEAVARALAAPELVATVRRKGNEVASDLRPGVHELAVLDGLPPGIGAGDGAEPPAVVVHARLATQPRAVRPGDLVGALFPDARERRVVRMNQWIDTDGARREPIELPNATSAARTPAVCA